MAAEVAFVATLLLLLLGCSDFEPHAAVRSRCVGCIVRNARCSAGRMLACVGAQARVFFTAHPAAAKA